MRLESTATELPAQADAVVIGGGIVGVSSAFYLAKAGLQVVLLEREQVSTHQSGRNWGFVRTQYRDPAELPLATEALAIWAGLEAELGRSVGWRRNGCIFVAETEAERATFADWTRRTRDLAPDARMISAAEVSALLPALQPGTHGALYTPSDGQAEPELATAALAQGAASAGVQVIEHCGAIAIDVTGGRVSGVETPRGRVASPIVVCAAGAQTHSLLAPLRLFLPQQVVRSTVSLTAPLPPISTACFCGFGIGVRQRQDGSCIIASDATADIDVSLDSLRAARFFLPELLRQRGGFSLRFGRTILDDLRDRVRGRRRMAVHPQATIPANRKLAERTVRATRQLFTGTDQLSIVRSWAGRIDVMPDALPVIDAPQPVPGLVVATGFSGHGFGLGPAAGRQVAQLAATGVAGAAIRPFRFDRFARGTYSRPHAPI